MRKKVLHFCGLGMLSAASITFAQNTETTGETAATQPENVVVTATRSAESLASLPMTVQVIDKEALLRQLNPGDNLANVLGKLVPSAGVETQVATEFSQNIRGRKILFLIDGVAQRDNRNISRFLNTISVDVIERIEVVSNASAVYGAGGAGGIVNIITRRGSGELSTQLSVGGLLSNEALTTKKLALSASAEVGAFDYLLTVSAEDRASWFDGNGNRIAPEPAQTSRSDAKSYGLFSNLGMQLNGHSRIGLTLDYYQDEQDTEFGPNLGGPGIPAVLSDASVEGVAVKGLKLDEQPESKRVSAVLSYQNANFFSSSLDTQLYYRQREYRFFPFPGSSSLATQKALKELIGDKIPIQYVNQSTSKAEAAGAKITLNTAISETFDITWGVDINRDKGEQRAIGYDLNTYIASGGLIYQPLGENYDYGPNVVTTTRAVFAHTKWQPTDRWTLRAGLRFDDIKAETNAFIPPLETIFARQYGSQIDQLQAAGLINGGSAPTALKPGTIRDQALLPNIGVSYQLTDSHTLFTNYTEGFELPDYARVLRDALSPNSVLLEVSEGLESTVVSDTELEALKVKSIELGWRMRKEGFNAEAAVFASRSDKTVVFNRNFTVDLLDQQKDINGFEASTSYYFNEQWEAGASYAYARGDTQQADGTALALSATEVSPQKFIAYMNFYSQWGDWSLQGLRVADDDRAFKDDPREATIKSYTLFDLSVRLPLPLGEVSFVVKNMFNRQYQTVYSQWAESNYGSFSGIAAQGRTLGATYKVAF
ncbi:MAG: TonB-dependent receptor [Gammaproteobacteria bacterium]|nr:TonB-dependent receptor [Gammaproteobacteria bacterium]